MRSLLLAVIKLSLLSLVDRSDMSETLVIFSRYPQPGKTKTRLIPALGTEGAAKLQQQMTEHTLNTAKQLLAVRNLKVEVHFTGGSEAQMAQWLGKDLQYVAQASGDLGYRMRSAFERAFKLGQRRVVIIGIDCPDLDRQILNSAFDALSDRDLILGSAEDGGYYLIGLSKLVPQLFENIAWGSDRVLEDTTAIAKSLQLNLDYLTTLADVDRPEDLCIWQKYNQ